ncbi:YdiU family protein [Cytophagaceae bacterium ABcell3]|nr:YdiU family protein [Cytophagaceae bacterium ABcell3]
MNKLSSKTYKNEFVNLFPGDESGDLRPRQTPGVFYSKVRPTPVKKPELIAWSDDLANVLEMEKPSHEDIQILGGNLVTPSMSPYAACYAGHQFGHWAGQLGDGRAITLGEWETSKGETYELQLKGAGPTPYSRRADGRAVLRSSVREYLISEAMHYLGVPTTRALSLVSTGEQVLRDMFYDGRAAYEPGAVVMRVAPSFLRFGNFEMLAAREDRSLLKKLINFTIDNYYPHITGTDKIAQWFGEVVERTASLMVEWLRVGFVHGVMNTDNMSILGLTIDYGPYSFLDNYDLDFTPNTTDLPGRRYAFGKQAFVGQWNLGCLGGALTPICTETSELIKIIEGYENIFYEKFYQMMGDKLGLDQVKSDDKELIHLVEKVLQDIQPDMTMFYQLLADVSLETNDEGAVVSHFESCLYKPLSSEQSSKLTELLHLYIKRIKANQISREESVKRMRAANPRFILRNYLLHQAIEELEEGKNDLFRKLEKAIKQPYSTEYDEFFVKRPAWADEKAGCSMLSCSS